MRSTETVLGDIAAMLAPRRYAGIRLDYLVTDQGKSRRIMTPEKHGTRTRYALVSPRPAWRAAGVKSVTTAMGLSEVDANRLLDLCEELGNINDMGGWPLTQDQEPARVVSASTLASIAGGVALEDAFFNLQTGLHGIATIVVARNTFTGSSGPGSQFTWFSLRRPDGSEALSLSRHALTEALMHRTARQPDLVATADRRLGRWAHIAGIPQEAFEQAMEALLAVDGQARPTHIQLEG